MAQDTAEIQNALQKHYIAAHELGLHSDGVFHRACDICYGVSTDAYAAECTEILKTYGSSPGALADFQRHFQATAEFDRYQNARSGLFLSEEPVYFVGRFLGLAYQGDGIHTTSSPEFIRLEEIAGPIRAGHWHVGNASPVVCQTASTPMQGEADRHEGGWNPVMAIRRRIGHAKLREASRLRRAVPGMLARADLLEREAHDLGS
jgi:hypothetical protein